MGTCWTFRVLRLLSVEEFVGLAWGARPTLPSLALQGGLRGRSHQALALPPCLAYPSPPAAALRSLAVSGSCPQSTVPFPGPQRPLPPFFT